MNTKKRAVIVFFLIEVISLGISTLDSFSFGTLNTCKSDIDSFYIQEWVVTIRIFPNNEANITHLIIFNGSGKSVVNIDLPYPNWRYEFSTLFGLVTPFHGKVVFMNSTELQITRLSNGCFYGKDFNYSVLNFEGNNKLRIIVRKPLSNETIKITYKLTNMISNLPPFSSFVYAFSTNHHIAKLLIDINAHVSWIVNSYHVSCMTYPPDIEFLTPIIPNRISHKYGIIEVEVLCNNVENNHAVEIELRTSQLPMIGEWNEAAFWFIIWSIIIWILTFYNIRAIFGKRALRPLTLEIYVISWIGACSTITIYYFAAFLTVPSFSFILAISSVSAIYLSYIIFTLLYIVSYIIRYISEWNLKGSKISIKIPLLPSYIKNKPHRIIDLLTIIGVSYGISSFFNYYQYQSWGPLIKNLSQVGQSILLLSIIIYAILNRIVIRSTVTIHQVKVIAQHTEDQRKQRAKKIIVVKLLNRILSKVKPSRSKSE